MAVSRRKQRPSWHRPRVEVQRRRESHAPEPLKAQAFVQINAPGFGNRWNTYPWSMQWWRGKLYVGTDKAYGCIEYVLIHRYLPLVQPYPPRRDPDLPCPQSPYDLPLQAEIWSYTPQSTTWECVHTSPDDVMVPGRPDVRVARDIGYRGMTVFSERDGTEALYVCAVSPRAINPALPAPRLLRSTDGVTFDPVPAARGSTLGEVEGMGFRAIAVYNQCLYVVAGGVYGAGVLLKAEDPASGNDCFTRLSPPGMRVNEMVTFNGFLYLGLFDPVRGYAVVKIGNAANPPYTFIPVVPYGAYRPWHWRGLQALSMYVFQDRLFVGTEFPAEVICIYPDDEWDLIVGAPRKTPRGRKYPLSGLGEGFDHPLTIAIQRMQEHDGLLYVGTFNSARKQRRLVPLAYRVLERHMGFDLYATSDGIHFSLVTDTGLDDDSNICARTMASTPVGLFLGAINERVGAKVYLAPWENSAK